APPRPGKPRCRLRPRVRQGARHDVGDAGRGRRCRPLQMQRAMVTARCPASRLRDAVLDTARRIPTDGRVRLPATAPLMRTRLETRVGWRSNPVMWRYWARAAQGVSPKEPTGQ